MESIKLSLADQMHLDDMEIDRRKELLGFSQTDVEALARAKPLILEDLDEIVDEFYGKQTAIDEIALIIGDLETLRRLRAAQSAYIADLFSGYYDIEYVNNRLRIGLVHKRIGVEPKYYLSAIKVLKDILRRVLKEKISDREVGAAALEALDKLLILDTEFVFDTYIRSMLSEIEAAKDKALRYARVLEDKVAERTQELARLSRVDALTGLLNKRAFMEEARLQIARSKRASTVVSVIYLDVDGFKEINDTQGHYNGDRALQSIGAVFADVIRETDIAGRYGGDEFCVILPSTDYAGAEKLAERLSRKTETAVGTSLSVGIASTGPDVHDTLDELLQRADRLMYATKAARHANGRLSEAIPDKSGKVVELSGPCAASAQ